MKYGFNYRIIRWRNSSYRMNTFIYVIDIVEQKLLRCFVHSVIRSKVMYSRIKKKTLVVNAAEYDLYIDDTIRDECQKCV